MQRIWKQGATAPRAREPGGKPGLFLQLYATNRVRTIEESLSFREDRPVRGKPEDLPKPIETDYNSQVRGLIINYVIQE